MKLPHPQFTLRALLVVMLVAGVLLATPRAIDGLYRASVAAAVRARIEECRAELEQPTDCGVMTASTWLELKELQETLRKLEAHP